MSSKKYEKVASIHTHFNIFRDVKVAHEGPITIDEQIKALDRFIHWHERQVIVGKALMKQLVTDKEVSDADLSELRGSEAGGSSDTHAERRDPA